MVEPEPEKKRKEKMWKRGRVFKERTQYSVWTRLFSTLGAKEQVSESEGKGSLTEKRLFKWGIPSIMKTMNDRLITLEIKYWTAVTGKDDAVQLEVEKKFKDLGPFTGPKTAEDKPCTATKFRTFHKCGSIFKEKEETIGDNIKERIFFKGGTEDSEEVTQKIIEGMDHIKMKIFNKIYRFPIPPENKFVFPDGMINYVRSWGFKKSSDFHHYFQDFVKDISEYAKEYLMDEYERGMEIGLEKATKGFTEIKKDMKNKWKERIDNILEPFLRKVDEVLENEEKIKDALQNIEEETTDEWKENVSEYLPRREIIRLKREFMENIDKIKRKIEKKEEKKEEIKPEEYFEEIKKYVVSLFVNTWEQTYKSVEEKVRDLTRTIEGKTEDGKKDESSKDQIGYGVDVIRDVYINLMDDTFDWIGGEKRMQKGGKTGVDDEGAKTGHEGLLRKYPNIAENIMTNELQEIQEILEANSVSAKAVVVFTHTYEVLMRAKCGREERTIKAFEKVIDATENNKKKILKDYKKIYDRDSYDPTKGRMIDKNI
ncbi:hypothetical protein HQ529_01685, partial [Candidatus Woesearchaeota archaeon]|nr:hypothetical protein [Candidatus Woesearchaeota archaeon]